MDVIAHEFGHIGQFKYGGFRHISNKRKELFADYLAGVYMCVRYGLKIQAVFDCFEFMGNSPFGSADHHGTAEERADALVHGYMTPQDLTSKAVQKRLEKKGDLFPEVMNEKIALANPKNLRKPV